VARQRLDGGSAGVASVDVSADGRFVAFVSLAPLTAGDDNGADDIYVLDRTTGRVTLESVTAGGRAAGGSSQHPRLSGDGRFLVFSTTARNLTGASVADGSASQVLRRDRATGVTTIVSHTPGHEAGNGWSGHPDISDDGRSVVFESRATDLLSDPDANRDGNDIYLFDATDGVIRRVSLSAAGQQPAIGQSSTPAISGSGRVITFTSTAPLDARARGVAGPGGPFRDVFVREMPTGVTRRISTTRDGRLPNGASYYPAISADGNRVAFVSTATDLDDDARATPQENIYLYDSQTPGLRLLSRSASGGAVDGNSRHPVVSGDGHYVLFSSDASNLACAHHCGPRADVNLVPDVYRVDTRSGIVDRVSGGASAREPWWNASTGAACDTTGRIVAFSSRQPVDEADLDHDDDLFVEVLPAAAEGSRAAGGPPCGNGLPRPLVYP
jgi:Tol biopolymer transport system component